MYLPFETLPGHAHVWIYQSNRLFSQAEKEHLQSGLKNLCEHWSAHDIPLHTSFALPLNHFVILAVDEQQIGASGCSIDSSVRYLKSLQQALGIDLFDRSRVAFLRDAEIRLYALAELKNLFENKTLSGDFIAFNNSLTTKSAWENSWMEPVRNSWMARYLPKSAVAP